MEIDDHRCLGDRGGEAAVSRVVAQNNVRCFYELEEMTLFQVVLLGHLTLSMCIELPRAHA